MSVPCAVCLCWGSLLPPCRRWQPRAGSAAARPLLVRSAPGAAGRASASPGRGCRAARCRDRRMGQCWCLARTQLVHGTWSSAPLCEAREQHPRGDNRGLMRPGHPQISGDETSSWYKSHLYLPPLTTPQAAPLQHSPCPDHCDAPGRWCR